MNQLEILTPTRQKKFYVIGNYAGNGTAAVVTHNQQLALNMDSILTIEGGKVISIARFAMPVWDRVC